MVLLLVHQLDHPDRLVWREWQFHYHHSLRLLVPHKRMLNFQSRLGHTEWDIRNESYGMSHTEWVIRNESYKMSHTEWVIPLVMEHFASFQNPFWYISTQFSSSLDGSPFVHCVNLISLLIKVLIGHVLGHLTGQLSINEPVQRFHQTTSNHRLD